MNLARRRRWRQWLALLVVWGVVAFCFQLTSARAGSASIRTRIAYVFGAHASTAILVAWCESRLNPDTVSGWNGSVGLFQADYRSHRKPGESFSSFRRRLTDVDRNLRFAFRLSRGGTDWTAWNSSRWCWS